MKPVAAVNADHQMTIRIRTLRGPIPIAHPAAGYFKQRVGDGEEARRYSPSGSSSYPRSLGDNGRGLRDDTTRSI